jgi:hypothetical protein
MAYQSHRFVVVCVSFVNNQAVHVYLDRLARIEHGLEYCHVIAIKLIYYGLYVPKQLHAQACRLLYRKAYM